MYMLSAMCIAQVQDAGVLRVSSAKGGPQTGTHASRLTENFVHDTEPTPWHLERKMQNSAHAQRLSNQPLHVFKENKSDCMFKNNMFN